MMDVYEIVITKTATFYVDAKNANDAYLKAEKSLNGEGDYNEYALDGWEIMDDLIEKVRK